MEYNMNTMLEKFLKSKTGLVISNLGILYLLWININFLLDNNGALSNNRVLALVIGAILLGSLPIMQVFVFFVKKKEE